MMPQVLAAPLCSRRALGFGLIAVSTALALPQPLVRAAPESTDVAESAHGPLHADPQMAAVVAEVRKNEELYQNLESIVVTTSKLAPANKQWSMVGTSQRAHTIQQGDLIYFRGEEARTFRDGVTTRLEHASQYDGDKTHSIEYGNSANIHLERYESPYIVPPHVWALFPVHVNFPLSVFLEGTEAIRPHPKVQRLPREMGTVFEFPKVETHFEGTEKVNDLKCVKIRVERWHSSGGPPMVYTLWLAPERNYICAKWQSLGPADKPQPMGEASVEAWDEVAPNVWLPAKISVVEGDWTRTLSLEKATLNVNRSLKFFSLLEIPEGLPVFTIKDGRLARDPIEQRKLTGDSAKRLAEVVDQIRAEEKKLEDFETTLVKTYQLMTGERNYGGNTTEHVLSVEEEGFRLNGDKMSYSAETRVELADGNTSESRHAYGFDGHWTRTTNEHRWTKEGGPHEQISAAFAPELPLQGQRCIRTCCS